MKKVVYWINGEKFVEEFEDFADDEEIEEVIKDRVLENTDWNWYTVED